MQAFPSAKINKRYQEMEKKGMARLCFISIVIFLIKGSLNSNRICLDVQDAGKAKNRRTMITKLPSKFASPVSMKKFIIK